ncbi:MAG TPA: hypothetical protein VFO76_12760, partial [Candidatus Kapabacteria bacterium]|nr:hypothetical protein [Candidatus Kapabacteria bacterium]
VLTNRGSSFCNEYDKFGSELMTAQMQGGSRLHQGKTTLPDLELYPPNSLPIGILAGDSTTFISPASLAFFQASTTDSSYGLVLSRNTNLADDAQISVHFLNNSLNWDGQFPETFCDNLLSFPYLSIAVFPQPFINSGSEIVRIEASNKPYKPISSILDIYMVNNTLIRHLDVLPEAFGGNYYQNWDGRDDAGKRVPSGVYYYTILTDGIRSSGKISVITK